MSRRGLKALAKGRCLHAAALCVSSGAMLTGVKRRSLMMTDADLCMRCRKALETAKYAFYKCECNAEIAEADPKFAETNYLTDELETSEVPVLYYRGLAWLMSIRLMRQRLRP